MKWFLDLSTRAKLLVVFLSALVVLGVVMGFAYNTVQEILEASQHVRSQNRNVIDFAQLKSDFNEKRVNTLIFLSTTNSTERQRLRAANEALTATDDRVMAALFQRNTNSAISERLERFNAQRLVFQERRARIKSLAEEGNLEQAIQISSGEQAQQYLRLREMLDEMLAYAEDTAQEAIASSEDVFRDSLRTFLLVGAVALVLGLIGVYSLSGMLAAPLRDLLAVAERIATGDLTMQVRALDRRDEVGQLSKAFQRMNTNLRQLNGEVQEGVNVLASSASEIFTATSQIAASATETATAVSQTTTTVEEVKQTAQVALQKASQVAEVAQKAVQSAQGGQRAVEDSVEGMERIREQMESIAESIVRLSEQSQAIGEIISTVNDLAEQSNLLAVNASIEAAKAGEHGKGFGVVAQEIRSLATQSKEATSQVRNILGDIQKATTAAVMATEQGSKAVDAGMRQANLAGEAIRTLSETITSAAQAATQINASSQQQLIGVDQVAVAMDNILQASKQNATGTQQADAGARNLADLGQKLKSVVQRFRI